MSRSLHYNIKTVRAISPQSLGATAGGGVTGKVVDRNGFESLEFAVGIGAIVATNATVTAVISDGDATGALSVATAASVIVKRRSKLTPDRRPILTPLASVPGPAARRVAVS